MNTTIGPVTRPRAASPLEVACPRCQAPAGRSCVAVKNNRGLKNARPHAVRVRRHDKHRTTQVATFTLTRDIPRLPTLTAGGTILAVVCDYDPQRIIVVSDADGNTDVTGHVLSASSGVFTGYTDDTYDQVLTIDPDKLHLS